MNSVFCFLLLIVNIVDADLVHKLDEEFQYEKSNEEPEPEFIKEFLEANSFKVKYRFCEEKMGKI